MKSFLFIMVFTLSSFQLFSGTCVLSVTRLSCPGKEAECFDKCKGKESCEETKKTGTISACSKEALRNCVVFRSGITKSKKITAKFDGQDVENGKDFCEPIKPEFNFNTCK